MLHIVGAGLAGLAAAVEAAQSGHRVVVYEASPQAGGRCRSFHDKTLDLMIDNGSHAVVGANKAVFAYLESMDASDRLVAANQSGDLPFYDAASGERWSIKPGAYGPLWVFDAGRRPPQTTATDLMRGLKLFWAGGDETVADLLPAHDAAWARFWHPLCTAVMNTAPEAASARLFGRAIRKMAFSGQGGLKTYVPRVSLEDTFVAPALATLNTLGARVEFNTPVKQVSLQGDEVVLTFRDQEMKLCADDRVILCVPPWVSLTDSPARERQAQDATAAIVNGHFKAPSQTIDQKFDGGVIGIINGTAEWVFTRSDVISVTVSAANALAEQASESIARTLWSDTCQALDLGGLALPAHRIIVERRATPQQTPAFARHRPDALTESPNVFRAGDWIETGLPCTLEGAILSGQRAARLAMKRG